jgi:hypothetical protein
VNIGRHSAGTSGEALVVAAVIDTMGQKTSSSASASRDALSSAVALEDKSRNVKMPRIELKKGELIKIYLTARGTRRYAYAVVRKMGSTAVCVDLPGVVCRIRAATWLHQEMRHWPRHIFLAVECFASSAPISLMKELSQLTTKRVADISTDAAESSYKMQKSHLEALAQFNEICQPETAYKLLHVYNDGYCRIANRGRSAWIHGVSSNPAYGTDESFLLADSSSGFFLDNASFDGTVSVASILRTTESSGIRDGAKIDRIVRASQAEHDAIMAKAQNTSPGLDWPKHIKICQVAPIWESDVLAPQRSQSSHVSESSTTTEPA